VINSIKGKKDKIILFSINNYFKDIINDLTGSKVDLQNLSFICFGYGHQFKSFKKLYSSIKIKYILDNKKFKTNESKELSIFHPSKIRNEDPQKTIVINCTSDHTGVQQQLKEYGFYLKQHKLISSQLLFPPCLLRIFISKDKIERKKFIELISNDNFKYLFTSNIEDAKKEIIISSLITDIDGFNRIEEINQELSLIKPNNKNIPIDIIIMNNNLLNNLSQIFPNKLIQDIYNSNDYKVINKIKIINKKFSKLINFYKLIYLSDNVFSKKELITNNKRKIYNRIYSLNNKDNHAKKILNIIKYSDYNIKIDQSRNLESHLRMRGINKPLLQNSIKSHNKSNKYEFILFVLRKSIIDYQLLDEFINMFKLEGLEYNQTTIFDQDIKSIATNEIRSGNWFSSKEEIIAGPPIGMVSFIDRDPKSNIKNFDENYPYRTSRIYDLKSKVRTNLSKLRALKSTINFFHSPDDEIEAFEYLELLKSSDKSNHLKFILSSNNN